MRRTSSNRSNSNNNMYNNGRARRDIGQEGESLLGDGAGFRDEVDSTSNRFADERGNTGFQDHSDDYDDDDGDNFSDESSSGSSATERKRFSTTDGRTTARNSRTNNDIPVNRKGSQSYREQDYDMDYKNHGDDAGDALLSDMDNRYRDEKDYNRQNSGSSRRSLGSQKREKRRTMMAGAAAGVAGLALIGPVTAVAAGVGAVVMVKRMDKKRKEKQKQDDAVGGDHGELASLISPRPQV